MRNLMRTLAAGLTLTAPAWANVEALRAQNDPGVESFFSVDFGTGARSASIARTDLVLSVERPDVSASFLRYYQDVDALLIPTPFGDVSTGPITVEIVSTPTLGELIEAGEGTFEFTTTDTYSVSFTEDLSALGLASPVLLDSTTTGTVAYDGAETGTISMVWQGAGVIGAPGNEIPFEYECRVNTRFSTQPGDIDLDGSVNLTDLGLVLSDFGCASSCIGDLDGSGATDLTDLNEVLTSYGQ